MKWVALSFLFIIANYTLAISCPDPSVEILLQPSLILKTPEVSNTTNAINGVTTFFPATNCLYSTVMNDYIKEDLRTHSLNMAQQFADQKRFYEITSLAENLGINLERLMPFVIALHDIGKPLSKQIYRSTDSQNAENRLLSLAILGRLGFAENEIKLADILISHDDIGNYLQGKITLEKVEHSLRTRAELSGFKDTVNNYFQLQLLYYISDATSHSWVKTNFFEVDGDGRLWPKNRKLIDNLMSRFK